MTDSDNSVSNSYKSVFVLDASKMSRLLNVIEGRFKDLEGQMDSVFETTNRKGKLLSASNVDAILDLDNPVKNPITRFTIRYHKGKEYPQNFCQVDFDSRDSEVDVEVRGENSKWVNGLFAEVEEQVERTFVRSLIYRVKTSGFPRQLVPLVALFISMIALVSFGFTSRPTTYSKSDHLSPSDIDTLLEISRDTLNQDQRVDFLFELHQRQISNLYEANQEATSGFSEVFGSLDLRTLAVFLPVILIVLALSYLYTKCYPGSVFLWGDLVEHYNYILSKRKWVWNTIIVSLIVGILGNLFVFGFARNI